MVIMIVLRLMLVVCLVCETLAAVDYYNVETLVENQCIQHCPVQNRSDLGHYDYACDYKCSIEQCSRGCDLWDVALSSTCQKACNGSSDRLSHRVLYCVIGCNDAIGRYFTQIRKLLGVPPAPALLDNSLGATTLRLEWRFPEASKARLTFHVQWRYEEISASWQYARNASWNPETSDFLVKGLQPYTKYRFRIALNLGHGHGDPIYSDRSVVIATLAAGVPASPPIHVRAAAVDSHSVSVSWEPGPFPYGPLLSYVIQITENDSSGQLEARSEVKDVPATSSFYVVRDLRPSKNYRMSVQMRNYYGSGPAATVQVSTPKEPQVSENQQPILILGTQHGIFELESLFGDSLHLFHSDYTAIEGIGIYISKQILFLSDANGSVWKIPVEQETKNTTRILAPENLDFYPLDISVDWINNQLYILGEVKPRQYPEKFLIKRCNIDGSSLTVALAGLTKRPTAIEIDPCNGYLFWTIRDPAIGGIYRLDVSDISNGIKHEDREERIVSEANLGAFIVDYTNFGLFVPNQNNNTMLTVSLDGKDIKNIRPNVVKPHFQNVTSLGTVNKKFYWTDGTIVYNEEYHQGRNEYFHNQISHLGKTQYKKILINLNSSQPWPIPLNPPTQLQAVFGNSNAKAKWLPPHLLGLQGKGAWQNWSYEISIRDLKTNNETIFQANTSSLNINNLSENTEYILKVSAFSKSGKGPWSSEFKGRTLPQSHHPIIVWSGHGGLMTTDAAIEKVETLIHKNGMNVGFTSIAWYKDMVYMVSNSSHIYWYNLTTHQHGKLSDIDSVGSIAVDWIGRRLYWSNPKQQLIIRSDLNGAHQESLPILTLAKEIKIDSVNGYLYWSIEYDVECAHLNGENKIVYEHLEPFSGKQVMGLTLDFDEKQVYWIVRGSDGSTLFRANMIGYGKNNLEKRKVALLQKPNMQGPMAYFSNRLLWLQDERNAVISDLTGKNIATLSGKYISGLDLVCVMDKSLQPWPMNNNDTINVIPDSVQEQSIKAIGSSESFNITWDKVTNVNYGTVFYEVQLDGLPANNATIITSEPTIRYWREVSPYQKLNINIRAFTYWASSSQVRTDIFSPPSTPSAPRNLRAYVEYEYKNSFEENNHFNVIFRWDAPLSPNGILYGYKVRCWYIEEDVEIDMCDDVKKSAEETEHIVEHLSYQVVYHFQVQAYTEMGTGDLSDPILVDPRIESPIPKLLIASSDSIYLHDIDENKTDILISGISAPIAITYLLRENELFWSNDLQELFVYHWKTLNKTKIADLKGKPKGLALDWLERSVFYVEGINDTTYRSVIYKVNLNYLERNSVSNFQIYNTTHNITKLEVSPISRKMYWIESDDGFNVVMYSDLDGNDAQPLFTDYKQTVFDEGKNELQCNCSVMNQVEPTFSIDHSNINNPRLVFIDAGTKNIFSSDPNGCICTTLANNVLSELTTQNIESDFGTIYWTDQTTLYALENHNNLRILIKEVEANDVKIYGNHMQPFPPKECLTPEQHINYTPTIIKKSYNMIKLKMPRVIYSHKCSSTSTPTPIYTVEYHELSQLEETRRNLSTFDKDFELYDLKPFTNYSISVAVNNHFSDKYVSFGNPLITRTSPGPPSMPREIAAIVLHPSLVQVYWLPPKELNGESVNYEIHWRTEGSLTGVRQKGEQPVSDLKAIQNNTGMLTTLLKNLSPNGTYTVWIRAYSETNEDSSDSEKIQVTTYPEPAEFVLVNKSSKTLHLTWEITSHIQEYMVEYAAITSNSWTKAVLGKNHEGIVPILVKNLTPKTQYRFRLSLRYELYPEWYVWPSDARFTFETLGDRPSPPGSPGIQISSPNMFKVVWEAPPDNGAKIELYSLECLTLRSHRDRRSTAANSERPPYFETAPSVEMDVFEWEQVYNGTENSWIITGLSDKNKKYYFRVSALNSYGWSDPSAESSEFNLIDAENAQKNPMNLILIATFLPISICITIVICFSYVSYSRKCSKQKKIEHVVAVPRGPDVELATLRELPRRGVHSTNILYVSELPNMEDITMLPHIRRDQITLTKFLGSGAFGEVFEGKAKGLSNGTEDTKVAVKTLKKGASEQEKTEFLQEAQLMSHFKHEHILELLGVCLDNDPQFIIMELMEGGDLLTYLRDSRGGLNNTPSMNLIELLKTCLDVTKGCKYLEEMHFVHRDLACRNCLVSCVESDNRIVKIGDFGLARDIYKNDYYRKEGEGLLPVRWMAPESLLDGVFTSQSDVWAYGVLLWEIMTLGQQPYQARSNLEVLHYVRSGGRLGKPTDCPDDLYKLMLKCWELEPEQRPTFKLCLSVLDQAHREHLRNPSTAAHSQYISTVPDRTSWRSDNEDDSSREKIPFLSSDQHNEPKETPKYLELLYEPEQESSLNTTENDGYEIPTDMISTDDSLPNTSQDVSHDILTHNEPKSQIS